MVARMLLAPAPREAAPNLPPEGGRGVGVGVGGETWRRGKATPTTPPKPDMTS